MTESSDSHESGVSEASGPRPVLSRPKPDETLEEFSARFLAEILEAHRSGGQPDADRE